MAEIYYIEDPQVNAYIRRHDGLGWYAYIPDCPGVWAAGSDEETVLNELVEAWKDWRRLG